METILFFIGSSFSHYNATFKLGKLFQERGYTIYYAGEESFKELVLLQGFHFYYINTNILANIESTSSKFTLKFFLKNLLEANSNPRKDELLSELYELDRIVKRLKPTLVMLDAFASLSYVFLQKHHVPCFVVQTMVSTHEDKLIPPLTSKFIPQDRVFDKWVVKCLWIGYYFKKYFRELKKSILFVGRSNLSLVLRQVKTDPMFFPDLIQFKKAFHAGLVNIPELILSPVEFDFPWKKQLPTQHHLGPLIELDRKEYLVDTLYHEAIQQIIEKQQSTYRPRHLVYCSLGTLASIHNVNIEAFYKKIIEAFRDKTNYTLILTVSKEVEFARLGEIPSHVYLFRKVPQIELLKKCDVMVTHGGLNSIMECILTQVPMVIYPLNSTWDQNGNAARVVYHKMGVCGNLKEKKEIIFQRIEEVLTNSSFKKNIAKMSKQFAIYNESTQVIDSILAFNKTFLKVIK